MSLRDIERVMEVMVWFHEHGDQLFHAMDELAEKEKDQDMMHANPDDEEEEEGAEEEEDMVILFLTAISFQYNNTKCNEYCILP